MKRIFQWLVLSLLSATNSGAQSEFATLSHQHVDLRILYTPSATPALSVVARDEDQAINHATNQVLLVAMPSAELTLPPGTPFGDAGAPFWILPQSQNVNLLYLGVSAEGIAPGVFRDALKLRLKRLEGPGYFMVWQATGPGQFNIRINTRDGVNDSDTFTPITGSHEHFNWGFSEPGLYRLTFQVEAQLVSNPQTIRSQESTFVFHVRPLPPPTTFADWQIEHWPPGFDPDVTGAAANADGDAFSNLEEYAFGLSPTAAEGTEAAPSLLVNSPDSEEFGLFSFHRNKSVLDLSYQAEATSTLPGPWTSLTHIFSTTETYNPLVEHITVKDDISSTIDNRFYRLRILRNQPTK